MLHLRILTLVLFFSNTNGDIYLGQNVPDPLKFNFTGVVPARDILFFLYTRDNGQNEEQLWVGDEQTLMQSTYNASKATKIVTHGWKSNRTSGSCVEVRMGFLTHDDYNVIVVDWGALGQNVDYITAASRVKLVGQYMARMIDFLLNEGTDEDSMTLVGHSLGGHVVGLAGHNLTTKVSQIVGLDPAGPGFAQQTADNRISSIDAQYVEIVHTSAGNLGIAQPVGDVDYYVNKGYDQPGCDPELYESCSHARSYMYYSESLTTPDLWLAIKCNDIDEFASGQCRGYPIVPFARWSAGFVRADGVYRLRTKNASPFGLGLLGVQPQNPLNPSSYV